MGSVTIQTAVAIFTDTSGNASLFKNFRMEIRFIKCIFIK